MRKNVASQVIGAQMVTAADGTAFTGSVTCSVTIDGGTQATGSVGSGACTHEGNGYHTYTPSQAETNGNLVAFTFTGTGAVPVTQQVYTVGYDPTVANLPANIIQAAGTAWGSGAITAASIASDAIAAAKIATGAITSAKFASGAIDAAAIASNALALAKVASDLRLALGLLHTGTAAGIAAGTITLASGHGITSTRVLVFLQSGTNAAGKARVATYSGSGDVFNVSPPWNANGETTPSGTIVYSAVPMARAAEDELTDQGLVLAQGTIGATGNDTTHLHLAGLAYADDDINDHLVVVLDVSAGVKYTTTVSDWANTGDLATVPTLPFTPEASVDRYWLLSVKASTGSAPTAADIRAEIDSNSTQLAKLGTPAGASVSADIAAVKAQTAAIEVDTQDIQGRIPAALVGGRIDATVDGTGMEAGAVSAIQSGLATAAALSTVDGKVDTLTTNIGTPTDTDIATDIANAHADVTTLLGADVTYKKNVGVTAFGFYMEATDGSPGTSLTVTVQVSLDGAAFNTVAGAVTEIGSGFYEVDLAQAEMNADEVLFKATATGAKQRNLKIRTQA